MKYSITLSSAQGQIIDEAKLDQPSRFKHLAVSPDEPMARMACRCSSTKMDPRNATASPLSMPGLPLRRNCHLPPYLLLFAFGAVTSRRG
jgi:hypothetical protein